MRVGESVNMNTKRVTGKVLLKASGVDFSGVCVV